MSKLNLLVLRCKDIEKTRGLYELLGYSFEHHRHGSGPEHLAHEKEGVVLELYPADSQGSDNVALGFAVIDLAAQRERLIAAGFIPSEIKNETWGRVFVVRDADNRRVEVKQL